MTDPRVRNFSKFFQPNSVAAGPPPITVIPPASDFEPDTTTTAPKKGPRAKKLTLEEKLRKECWAIHYGPTLKTAMCMFCGIRELDCRVAAGWVVAHIVPETHCADPSSPYYVVPCCLHCNGVMYQQNALDFLWDGFKVDALRQLCHNVYLAFTQRNGPLEETDCIWKLVKHLYGHEEHQLGGGITAANEEAIYKTLMVYQTRLIEEEISSLMSQVKQKSVQLEALVTDLYRPSKRVRHFV